MAGPDDRSPVGQLQQGFAAADAQPAGNVGQVCENCPDNWVEAGATDEATGQPIPGIGYRIFDLATGDRVASGVLDSEGKSPRHSIPMPVTQLYLVVGTEAAMDTAEAQIAEAQRQHALRANARPDWNGIPAGLDQQGFNRAYDQRTHETSQLPPRNAGLLDMSASGWKGIWDYVSSGFDGDAAAREFYQDERARSFDEYQLVTGAREASRWESLGGGAAQGVTFGFGEEAMAGLDALMSNRTYEEAVAARRQIIEAQRIANPNTFIGGEIAGAIPTIFIPVGGAAGRAVQAGRGASGAMRAGATTGAATGALSGAGHDQGGVLDRLDGAAIGAVTGGMSGALLAGAGVLIARGIARTRIWARAARLAQQTSVDPRKFSEYIFSPSATHGKDVPFRSLGYSAEHSEELAAIWSRQAADRVARGEYTLGRLDQYGPRINVEIALPGRGAAAGRTSYMNSGWMLGADGSLRLNTPFSGFTRGQ
jgi:hypothetical protein